MLSHNHYFTERTAIAPYSYKIIYPGTRMTGFGADAALWDRSNVFDSFRTAETPSPTSFTIDCS
ncbi:MAG: hypothetical protein ACYC27_14310 [Armatimonadota bacterium]